MLLDEYIESARHRPFEWGQHDCVHFVRGWVNVCTGEAIPLPTYRNMLGAYRAKKSGDPIGALDARFPRCPHVPPRGSIVCRHDDTEQPLGYRFGIVVSDRAAFVSPNGLVFDRLKPGMDIYWTLPCAAP